MAGTSSSSGSGNGRDGSTRALEARVVELELKYTEQQALVQELSDVIYAQQRQLDAMEAKLALLQKRFDAVGEPGLVDAKADEKPPHY